MMRNTIRSLLVGLTVGIALAAAPVLAAQIEIQFTGLDLKYDGTDIYDAGGAIGGNGAPAEADPLTTMTFLNNGTLVGSQSVDIAADVYIKNVPNIPPGSVVTTGGNGNTFGFDLLTKNQVNSAWGLQLNIDKFDVFYTGFEIAIVAGGSVASIGNQDLPFGLIVGQPVSIVVSSTNLKNVTTSGGNLSGFDASGTGSLVGNLVPEPSSIALAMSGLALGGLAIWRRRRAA